MSDETEVVRQTYNTTTTTTPRRYNPRSNQDKPFPCVGLSQRPKPPSRCPLFCCFYAEFDNKVGPKICYQSPQKFMDQDIRIPVHEMEKCLADAFDQLQTARGDIPAASAHTHTAPADDGDVDDDDDEVTPQTTTRKTISSEKQTNIEKEEDEDPMQTSIFDSCSEYIITGSELTGNIINLSTHHIHVLTRPTMISDEKYERNSLLFCVGFVLRRTEDPRPFRPALSKLAVTLRDMEVESQFLSRDIAHHRPQIQALLQSILVSLNSEACECNLLLGKADVLNLKLFRPPRTPATPVPDYAVPILLRRDWQVQTYDWDLSINWVSLHIDGVSNASLISKKAEVDMEMVQACLRVLKHHGVIALVDMFFYSNRYECTEKAAALFRDDDKLLQDAIEFVIRRRTAPGSASGIPVIPYIGSDVSSELLSTSPRFLEQHHNLSSSPGEPIKEGHMLGGVNRLTNGSSQQEFPLSSHLKKEEYNVIKKAIPEFICACSRSTTIGDLWIGFMSGRLPPSSVNWKRAFQLIDHRRLITFGLVHGLIQRVHNFPLLVDDLCEAQLHQHEDLIQLPSLDRPRSHELEEKRKVALRIASMMDGKHCDDELVCAFDLPLEEIYSLFEGKRILSIYAPVKKTE